jgi:hypothetical protein
LKGAGVNTKGYSTELARRIEALPAGTIFVSNDFSDIADIRTIRELLGRRVEAGEIRRILPGVFVRPLINNILNEEVPPTPDAIANAIARAYGWTIAPSGQTALNRLGLSTQIPMVWTYVSDGPYRSLIIDDIQIKFNHVANKNISGMSSVTLLVVQGLKALGKDEIDEDIINKIQMRLTDDDRKVLSAETVRVSFWIRNAINKLVKSGENAS